MRVLVVHNQLWAHYKSKLFSELYRLSPQFGIKVHVAQIALSEKSRAQMGQANELPYDYDYEVLFEDALENVKTSQRAWALFKKMRQYRPDLLNLTGYYDPAQLLLLLYAKCTGVKVIISNESNVRDARRSFLKETFKKLIVRLADGFFCFGQSSVAYLELLGVPKTKILSQRAAIVDDTLLKKRFAEAHLQRATRKQTLRLPAYNFIFVGRFIAPKNLLTLLRAFGQLNNAQQWGLLLLGEGEQKTDLEAYCTQNQLENVIFLPGVPWFEVPDYLSLADVFVLPSVSEPWGLVVNEAMLGGLSVVVSERCGCVEDLVKNGQNGFVFDPNKADELTQKLQYFLDNPLQIKPMGDVSKQMVAAFDSEQVALEMLTAISRMRA